MFGHIISIFIEQSYNNIGDLSVKLDHMHSECLIKNKVFKPEIIKERITIKILSQIEQNTRFILTWKEGILKNCQ